jgi:quercetin dioxygenase-like cupin family protein
MADPILGRFAVDDEIARFPPAETAAGRRAETLVKADGLRVVLVTMLAGAALHEHTAPGPITIHALRGRFAVDVGDETHELAPGGVIAVEAKARHAVRALADGAFLLTIGWPGPSQRGDAASPPGGR